MSRVNVLFVCLGNICRSPTAHGVFQKIVDDAGLSDRIAVDSCGTGDWHIGRAPDPRAQQAALTAGYDLSQLRARQVTPADFEEFDYILAMDKANLRDLKRMCPDDYHGHLSLFLDYASGTTRTEVPDPYYGEDDGFTEVLALVEDASRGLLDSIRQQWR